MAEKRRQLCQIPDAPSEIRQRDGTTGDYCDDCSGSCRHGSYGTRCGVRRPDLHTAASINPSSKCFSREFPPRLHGTAYGGVSDYKTASFVLGLGAIADGTCISWAELGGGSSRYTCQVGVETSDCEGAPASCRVVASATCARSAKSAFRRGRGCPDECTAGDEIAAYDGDGAGKFRALRRQLRIARRRPPPAASTRASPIARTAARRRSSSGRSRGWSARAIRARAPRRPAGAAEAAGSEGDTMDPNNVLFTATR